MIYPSLKAVLQYLACHGPAACQTEAFALLDQVPDQWPECPRRSRQALLRRIACNKRKSAKMRLAAMKELLIVSPVQRLSIDAEIAELCGIPTPRPEYGQTEPKSAIESQCVESPAAMEAREQVVEQDAEQIVELGVGQDEWRNHGRELLEALADLDAMIPFALAPQAMNEARAAKEREVQDWRITGILQGYGVARTDLEEEIDVAAIKFRTLRRIYRSREFDQSAVVDALRAIRDGEDPVLAEQAQAIIAVPNRPDPRPTYPRAPLPRDRQFSQRLCSLFRTMTNSTLTDLERNTARSQLERFNGDGSDKSLLAGFLLRLAAWLDRHPGERCPPLPVSEAVPLVADTEFLIKHVAARQDRAPERVDGIWNGLPAGI